MSVQGERKKTYSKIKKKIDVSISAHSKDCHLQFYLTFSSQTERNKQQCAFVILKKTIRYSKVQMGFQTWERQSGCTYTMLCSKVNCYIKLHENKALCHFKWHSFIMFACVAFVLPASWSMAAWTLQHNAYWPSITQRAALCCAWSTPLASCLQACGTEPWWYMEEITVVRWLLFLFSE